MTSRLCSSNTSATPWPASTFAKSTSTKAGQFERRKPRQSTRSIKRYLLGDRQGNSSARSDPDSPAHCVSNPAISARNAPRNCPIHRRCRLRNSRLLAFFIAVPVLPLRRQPHKVALATLYIVDKRVAEAQDRRAIAVQIFSRVISQTVRPLTTLTGTRALFCATFQRPTGADQS